MKLSLTLSLSLPPSSSSPLLTEPGASSQEVLNNTSQMLKRDHNFAHTTLQVEEYHQVMESCKTCCDWPKKGKRSSREV